MRKYKVTLYPSESKYIQIAFNEINSFLNDWNWSEIDRFAVEIALDEAFMNALLHGNRENKTKRIEVTYEITPDQIILSVADEGNGFSPKSVPDPRKTEYLTKSSGRGIFLIRNFMNDAFYNEKGNKITMKKIRTDSI